MDRRAVVRRKKYHDEVSFACFAAYLEGFRSRQGKIHSLSFKGLSELINERVCCHLSEELSREADNHLSLRGKKTLLGILEETVPDFRRESYPLAGV